ncbi:hypothetical protein ACLI1L_000184 [Corynebacterium sp. LaCa117]|uniref:hypothetical protein n=1 Tax=Corynebacterium sp. LaCa117 TaxID=3391424 RepID=UPI0039899822
MKKPLFRVYHPDGHDRLKTDGTLDFDGGSLLVWRDNTRTHLVAAYSPGGWITAHWETNEEEAEDA